MWRHGQPCKALQVILRIRWEAVRTFRGKGRHERITLPKKGKRRTLQRGWPADSTLAKYSRLVNITVINRVAIKYASCDVIRRVLHLWGTPLQIPKPQFNCEKTSDKTKARVLLQNA